MSSKQPKKADDIFKPESCLNCKKKFDFEKNLPLVRDCSHSSCASCIKQTCPKCKREPLEKWKNPENKGYVALCKGYTEDENNREKHNHLDEMYKDVSSIRNLTFDLYSEVNNLISTYSLNLRFLTLKAQKYTGALGNYFTSLGYVHSIWYSQTAYPLASCILKGHSLMTNVITSQNADKSLKSDLTHISALENLRGRIQPYKFEDFTRENIKSLKGADNCHVGYRIDGKLRYGEIRTIQKNTLLFSSFKIPEEGVTENPSPDATLVHFNWLKKEIKTASTFFLQFEMKDEDLKTSRKEVAECPKTILLFISLSSDFKKCPYAEHFYHLCIGDKGKSYVNSQVVVCANYIKVIDKRPNYLIPRIDDGDIKGKEFPAGCVIVYRKEDGKLGLCINKSNAKMKDNVIGHVYDCTIFKYFNKGINMKITDCGFVLVH